MSVNASIVGSEGAISFSPRDGTSSVAACGGTRASAYAVAACACTGDMRIAWMREKPSAWLCTCPLGMLYPAVHGLLHALCPGVATSKASRLVRSIRRHVKQQDVPTELFSGRDQGGMPELGRHRRQVVRWQCEHCVLSARLFLAQSRRRHLPEHKCEWQRAPKRAAVVRRCAESRTTVACIDMHCMHMQRDTRAHTRTATVRPAKAHVDRRGCNCRAQCNRAHGRPSRWYGCSSPVSLHGLATALRGKGSRAVMSGFPCSLRDWQHKQQRLPAKLFSAQDRGGMPELGGHRGRKYVCRP
jgi:hypothetical protein